VDTVYSVRLGEVSGLSIFKNF